MKVISLSLWTTSERTVETENKITELKPNDFLPKRLIIAFPVCISSVSWLQAMVESSDQRGPEKVTFMPSDA